MLLFPFSLFSPLVLPSHFRFSIFALSHYLSFSSSVSFCLRFFFFSSIALFGFILCRKFSSFFYSLFLSFSFSLSFHLLHLFLSLLLSFFLSFFPSPPLSLAVYKESTSLVSKWSILLSALRIFLKSLFFKVRYKVFLKKKIDEENRHKIKFKTEREKNKRLLEKKGRKINAELMKQQMTANY